MADYRPPVDELQFLMKEVFQVPELWARLPGLEELDGDTAEAILIEAGKVCADVIAPLNREADEEGCVWQDGCVKAPKGFQEAYQTYRDGGWTALGGNPEYDGMGMPKTLMSGAEEMLQGSCMAFGLLPMLTSGATLAIDAHASDELKKTYLPKMYSGEWTGVMGLTEPHAGTDLGLIRSKAEPNDDGSYSITGTKIFITWGEQDITSNIIHLVLAKLPDAPSGSRGISLFIVPKKLLDDNGEPAELNNVVCGSLEKKMGIKASATCVMNFDGSKGWLVGEPHKGLACMFTMMNYERLVVGIQGLSNAEASYQVALDYAKERIQGRSPEGPKQPGKPADNLLVHADVRRMLLEMKALNEAGRAFYTYVAYWLDIAKFSQDKAEKQRGDKMVALLTPVAKAFLTDMSLAATLNGQMVLGGHGYIREWGQEQFVRDTRITQIYEGTNGIQAMDLIGRKTVSTQGGLLEVFIGEINQFIGECGGNEQAQEFILPLKREVERLRVVTEDVVKGSEQNPNAPGAAATDYLHFMGYVCYAYMWSKMAVVAQKENISDEFRESKLNTARFYFAKLLPQTEALEKKILAGADTVMAMDERLF